MATRIMEGKGDDGVARVDVEAGADHHHDESNIHKPDGNDDHVLLESEFRGWQDVDLLAAASFDHEEEEKKKKEMAPPPPAVVVDDEADNAVVVATAAASKTSPNSTSTTVEVEQEYPTTPPDKSCTTNNIATEAAATSPPSKNTTTSTSVPKVEIPPHMTSGIDGRPDVHLFSSGHTNNVLRKMYPYYQQLIDAHYDTWNSLVDRNYANNGYLEHVIIARYIGTAYYHDGKDHPPRGRNNNKSTKSSAQDVVKLGPGRVLTTKDLMDLMRQKFRDETQRRKRCREAAAENKEHGAADGNDDGTPARKKKKKATKTTKKTSSTYAKKRTATSSYDEEEEEGEEEYEDQYLPATPPTRRRRPVKKVKKMRSAACRNSNTSWKAQAPLLINNNEDNGTNNDIVEGSWWDDETNIDRELLAVLLHGKEDYSGGTFTLMRKELDSPLLLFVLVCCCCRAEVPHTLFQRMVTDDTEKQHDTEDPMSSPRRDDDNDGADTAAAATAVVTPTTRKNKTDMAFPSATTITTCPSMLVPQGLQDTWALLNWFVPTADGNGYQKNAMDHEGRGPAVSWFSMTGLEPQLEPGDRTATTTMSAGAGGNQRLLQSLQRAVATARVMVQQQHGVIDDTKNIIVHEKLLDRIEALCGDFQSQSHTEVAWRAMADERARTIDRLVTHSFGGASGTAPQLSSPELPHSTTTTSPNSGTHSSSSGGTKNGHFSWERVQSLQRVIVAARSKNHDKDHDTDGDDATITTEELCAVAESLCKVYETQCRTVAVLQTVCHERGQTLDRLFQFLTGSSAVAAAPGLPPLMPPLMRSTTANGSGSQTTLLPSLMSCRQRADTPIPLFGFGGDF
jgi:hypothetical protein